MREEPYRTALVTGASVLVGQALVERLSRSGIVVHAVSRDEKRLDALAERTGCVPHKIDIIDTQELIALTARLEPDVLINNAGVSAPRPLARSDTESIDAQVDVNLRAVLHLVRLVVPGMIERNRGHIVSIGSIAGHYAFAGNAVYHATKAALHQLTRQLRFDLQGSSVRVTEITPGRIRTEMFAKALNIRSEEAEQRYFEGYEPLLPEDIADAVAFALDAPRRVNISHVEILPTMQVPGGLTMTKSLPE